MQFAWTASLTINRNQHGYVSPKGNREERPVFVAQCARLRRSLARKCVSCATQKYPVLIRKFPGRIRAIDHAPTILRVDRRGSVNRACSGELINVSTNKFGRPLPPLLCASHSTAASFDLSSRYLRNTRRHGLWPAILAK